MLKNEMDHDVLIPVNGVIAKLNLFQCTYEETSNRAERTNNRANITFVFRESCPVEGKERITEKFKGMTEVFALHGLDFGHIKEVKHQIKLTNEAPFEQLARPIDPNDLEAVRKHLQELTDLGVIRESQSPFLSPISGCAGKNGDVRLCVDYRRLNMQTVKDAYTLHNLEETFTTLTGLKWFSVLDLKSGYY